MISSAIFGFWEPQEVHLQEKEAGNQLRKEEKLKEVLEVLMASTREYSCIWILCTLSSIFLSAPSDNSNATD